MKSSGSDWYKDCWSLDIKNQSWVENTAVQVDFIIRALGLKGNERILDLACGYGRHSLEFARRGYSVVGADITEDYVKDANKEAKAQGLDAEFILSDIRDVNFENEFDLVLNMADGAVGYLENDEENLKIFDVISKALKPGGKHFVDTMNAGYADSHFPCQLWDAGEKGLTLSKFEWDKNSRILLYGQIDTLYGEELKKPEFVEGFPQRLYSVEELREIMEKRGMTVQRSFADFTDKIAEDTDLQMEVYSVKQ